MAGWWSGASRAIRFEKRPRSAATSVPERALAANDRRPGSLDEVEEEERAEGVLDLLPRRAGDAPQGGLEHGGERPSVELGDDGARDRSELGASVHDRVEDLERLAVLAADD